MTYTLRDFDQDMPDLNGKSILVTGGTGSFGSAFVRKVLKEYKVKRLIIYSRDELKQYEMEQQLSVKDYPELRYFIGDVRDAERLRMATRNVDLIVHAAAMKHVTAAEYNPFECIHTNVIGAENIVKAAIDNKVSKVLAMSTDKAASPVNLYGASKLAADKIFVAANNLAGDQDTSFAVVRYGNVVCSRGSVIPFFQNLLSKGAEELPITHEEMTRFFITLRQGVNFVLSSIQQMQGGEIFIPKIPSMKITDMAAAMAPDVPQKVIGIRPGEKIHEQMIGQDDAMNSIELDDRYVILPAIHPWKKSQLLGDKSGYKALPDGFSYSSDSNTEWLDDEGLFKMLKQ